MKSYPSIASSTGQNFREFGAYVFDKIDGSCLRWEWSPKQSWHKFGTRRRLFGETDEDFGCSIEIFFRDFAEKLSNVAIQRGWPRCVAFTEFWGKNSFAGLHDPDDEKFLTLIDISVYKRGFINPLELARLDSLVPSAEFLGQVKWTRGFVEAVRNGKVENVTFEGVVGKRHAGTRIMAKAKTQVWIDKVRALYAPEEAERIITS